MMKVWTSFVFIAMIASSYAIEDCSIRTMVRAHVKHGKKRHHGTLTTSLPVCGGSHKERTRRVRSAMKVYSDNNVTVHARMRSDDGLETAWVPLENIRDLSSVRWLQETPLNTITVEHRMLFANGTSSESQTRLNSSSTARDWAGGDFSRTLLWDGWDTFWTVVTVIVVAAVVVVACVVLIPSALTVIGLLPEIEIIVSEEFTMILESGEFS